MCRRVYFMDAKVHLVHLSVSVPYLKWEKHGGQIRMIDRYFVLLPQLFLLLKIMIFSTYIPTDLNMQARKVLLKITFNK